jgi:hypothetical protein
MHIYMLAARLGDSAVLKAKYRDKFPDFVATKNVVANGNKGKE